MTDQNEQTTNTNPLAPMNEQLRQRLERLTSSVVAELQGFEDIVEAGWLQAWKDCWALDYRLWKHTEGPGMPGSRTRNAWDAGYDAAMVEIEQKNSQKLSVLARAAFRK